MTGDIKYVLVNETTKQRIDNKVYDRYLQAEAQWLDMPDDEYNAIDIQRGVIVGGQFEARD